MKEHVPFANMRFDGSLDMGNGVIGPSLSDRDYFNSKSYEDYEEADQELASEGFVAVSSKGKLGKLLKRFGLSDRILPVVAVLGFVSAACDTGVKAPTEQQPTPTPSESASPTPKTIWYYTGGPHFDGLSKGVRYAIDAAPGNSNRCPGGDPVTSSPFPSPTEGKVTAVGNEHDPSDPNFSIVEISTPSGEIIGAMHLANIRVETGDTVSAGQLLGDPSCDSPPGGKSDGTHIHLYRKGIDGEPLPMAGVQFSEGIIYDAERNYDGFIRKGSVTKTADARHCGPGEASINVCGGIRNDLSEPLHLVSTGHGSFRMELRSADGNPIPNQEVNIFKTKKDINGNSVLGEKVKRISSGNTGALQATLLPGEYILLFSINGKVYGPRFDEKMNEPGISGVVVNKDKVTGNKLTLGQVQVNIKDENNQPSQHGSACLTTSKNSNNEYDVVCSSANDKGEIRLNALPDEYKLEVSGGAHGFFVSAPNTTLGPIGLDSNEIITANCQITTQSINKPKCE